jgi:hypothetical protein
MDGNILSIEDRSACLSRSEFRSLMWSRSLKRSRLLFRCRPSLRLFKPTESYGWNRWESMFLIINTWAMSETWPEEYMFFFFFWSIYQGYACPCPVAAHGYDIAIIPALTSYFSMLLLSDILDENTVDDRKERTYFPTWTYFLSAFNLWTGRALAAARGQRQGLTQRISFFTGAGHIYPHLDRPPGARWRIGALGH